MLLERRGISGESEILEFLSNKPQKTYDPFLLLNLEAGVDFILSEIADGKKLCIYGDYDADGVTSTCILYEVLRQLTDRLDYYIPSRFEEGYGLNCDAVKEIREQGTELLITVDCGSTSCDEVELAKSMGMSVVVTDHHAVTGLVPDCLVINPNQENCRYPFKGLAGCGVAFKLAQGIQQKAGLPKAVLNRALDLLAVGTIGDIVPLVEENRTMVKYGIKMLRRGNRPGLKKLIEEIGLHPESVRSDQIAFGIVPHINAAGRMAHAKTGVELLLARDPQIIAERTKILKENNQKRKNLQETAYNYCIDKIETGACGRFFLMVKTDQVHEGIAGIVAGKLKDKYVRPTVLVTPSKNGYLKGTGRSIPGIDLYELLKTQESLFERFGGHEGACGFSIKEENLPALHDALEMILQKRSGENQDLFSSGFEADLILEGSDITLEFARQVEQLAPFGRDNEKPVFLLEDILIGNPVFMGDTGTHARFTVQCQDGCSISCLLFQRAKDYQDVLQEGEPADLLGNLDIQEWNGKRSVRFLVKEIL